MRISRKHTAVFASLAALFAIYGCAASNDAPPTSKTAKDFTLPALSGETISLSQYAGKSNVLVHFGTTWCPPCIAEIPTLKSLQTKYGPGKLVVLYVDSNERRETVESFVKQHGINYPTLIDADGAVSRAYGINAIPQNVLVNKEGQIAAWSVQIPENAIQTLVGG